MGHINLNKVKIPTYFYTTPNEKKGSTVKSSLLVTAIFDNGRILCLNRKVFSLGNSLV